MKKQILAYTLILLCTLLCACETTTPVETSTASVTTTAAPIETTVAPVETTAIVTTIIPVETTTALTTTAPIETTPTTTTGTSSYPINPITTPDVEHTVLQNADGKYVGVLFTYPDGSTYRWDCPVESEWPILVRSLYGGYEFIDGHIIEYYVGNGEWLFDRIDIMEKKILYRHVNVEGKHYTFGTLGLQHQNGTIQYSAAGASYTCIRDGERYDYSFYKSNIELPIAQVLPLTSEDTVPETIPYSRVFTTVPTNWTYDESNYMFYEPEIQYFDEFECVLRIIGLNTLYYSDTAIDNVTQEQAMQMFPEDAPLFEYYASPDTFASKDQHSTIHFFHYRYYDTDDTPGDLWENDPKATYLDLSSKLIAIVQLDAHYFAKVEIGLTGRDETRETTFIPVCSNLMYF